MVGITGVRGKLSLVVLLGIFLVCVATGMPLRASGLSIFEAVPRGVTVNAPLADIEVYLPIDNGLEEEWCIGVPVTLEVLFSEEWGGLQAPPGCGDFVVLRFSARGEIGRESLRARVFPSREAFQGLSGSVLYRLSEAGGESRQWRSVENWSPGGVEDLSWSFDFDGREEAIFLLGHVGIKEGPLTGFSGEDWRLEWQISNDSMEKSEQRDSLNLTFAGGGENDPGSLYFSLVSTGEWNGVGDVVLDLYFDSDPEDAFCLFQRVLPGEGWACRDLASLVQINPDNSDDGWLGDYGYRIHITFSNEMLETMVPLEEIQFRLGSCVMPGVEKGAFPGGSPKWKLVYRSSGDGPTDPVRLVPRTLEAVDLEGLSDGLPVSPGLLSDSLFCFNLAGTEDLEGLWAYFWLEYFRDLPRCSLWIIEEHGGDGVVPRQVPCEVTEWSALEEPLVSGDAFLTHRLWVDLSRLDFDEDTLFVLGPLSGDLCAEATLKPRFAGAEGEEGGCSVGRLSPLLLFLVPLGLLLLR